MSKSFQIALAALFAGLGAVAKAQDSMREFWPQANTYISLNSAARIFVLASFKNHQDANSWQGDFGAHLDFALKPVFRRELRQRDDVFNRRFLSFLAGYRFITTLDDAAPYTENRLVVESTARYLLPKKMVWSDRSRGEFRFIRGQSFSSRYRNRMQLERDFGRGRFVYTPYANAEFFYDTRYDAWNRRQYSAGVQFPAGKSVWEPYYLRRNDSRSNPPHLNVVGFKIKLYF